MRGEIITIGDELISGRVCDLNSFFLSARASSFGLEIKRMCCVGDDPERIIDILKRAVGRADFVLVSGGLGPTEDDITTEVASRFFDRPLVLDGNFLESIKKSLESRDTPWVESYRKMAMLPEGATTIDPDGTACGFYLYHGRVPVFFLPGVPEEVRTLTEMKVLPLLLESGPERMIVRQRLFKLFGIQEARIGEILKGLTAEDRNVLVGYYPNFPENFVTLTVRSPSGEKAGQILARLESEVDRRLGSHVVAKDNATLEGNVGLVLKKGGLTLAVAESCTGGLISRRMTSVSGSSDYFDRGIVAYSNRAKMELLGVPPETLERHGAVSAETAKAMAEGVRKNSGTHIGLASTGIAGPTGGTAEKPVGTVFIGVAGPEGGRADHFHFSGNRNQVTIMTAQMALKLLYGYLTDDTFLFRH